MALDVKNFGGGDTGSANNGRVVIANPRGSTTQGQFLDSPGFSEFAIAGFDTSPPGCVLADRFDDPRYYTGDLVT